MNEKTYELLLLMAPDQTEKDQKALIESVKQHIKDAKGKLLSEEMWGLRDLAYRIKQHKQGMYLMMNVQLPATAIKELEEFFNVEQKILRYLMTIPPVQYESVSYPKLRTEEEKVYQKASVERFSGAPAKRREATPTYKKAESVVPKTAPEKAPVEAKTAEEPKSEKIAEELDAKLSKIIEEDMGI